MFRAVVRTEQSSVDKNQEFVAADFQMVQNYPNPFNHQTVIEFKTNRAEMCELQIVDIQGRHVETLCRQMLSAGVHQFTWNAEGQSSGIYIARLMRENQQTTLKMLYTR